MHDLTVGAVVNALSGGLMISLGFLVFRTRRSSPANRSFALFAITFGLVWLLSNLTFEAGHYGEAGGGASGMLALVAAAALLRLALVYPVPARTRSRRTLAGAALAGSAMLICWYVMLFLTFRPIYPFAAPWSVVGLLLYNGGLMTLISTGWGILFLLAFGHRETGRIPETRSAALLLSISLLPYFAFALGQAPTLGLRAESLDQRPYLGISFTTATVVGFAGAWLFARRGADRRGALEAWLPVLAGALVLGGMVAALRDRNNPGFGITRIFMVVMLAYGIVRHQLFGIDVKVKWTISKTTLAGIFIAVFFVASEAAQEFFGETLGSSYVGILAAGLLVFAIAPLSRFADRVADRAMPGVKAVGEMTEDERRGTYREAAITAWRDGAIDVSERALLDRLRESLGLSEHEAHRIESEAAGQVGPG